MLKTYNQQTLFQMNPTSKVWVYVAKSPISEPHYSDIMKAGNEFVKNWAAHGTELNACFSILNEQIIVLAVDQTMQEATGCSIDSSVQFIKLLDQKYQLDLFERMRLLYKDDKEEVQTINLQNAGGKLSENTIVFDHLADTVGSLNEAWKRAADTWVVRFI